MGPDIGAVRSGPAPGAADPAAQGRAPDPPRLAPQRSPDRAAALRLGLGLRPDPPGLRRTPASDRTGRAGSVPRLRQSVLPGLSRHRLPALRARGRRQSRDLILLP